MGILDLFKRGTKEAAAVQVTAKPRNPYTRIYPELADRIRTELEYMGDMLPRGMEEVLLSDLEHMTTWRRNQQ